MTKTTKVDIIIDNETGLITDFKYDGTGEECKKHHKIIKKILAKEGIEIGDIDFTKNKPTETKLQTKRHLKV